MGLSPEALYHQLRQLVDEMPDLKSGPITSETNKWLGRAISLIESVGDVANVSSIRVAARFLDSANRAINAQTIATIVYATLVKAQMDAPVAMQDSFLPVGQQYDTIMAVSKVMAQATFDAFIIDPYGDATLLEDYAVLAPELVRIRVLVGESKYKPSLKPATKRWTEQFRTARPLEVRVAPRPKLHDRHIILDGSVVWTIGQSFNRLAEHSPTGITRTVDSQTAADKIAAYEDIWGAAVPLPAV